MELSNPQAKQVWLFEHIHPTFTSEAQKERIVREIVMSLQDIFKNNDTADAEI